MINRIVKNTTFNSSLSEGLIIEGLSRKQNIFSETIPNEFASRLLIKNRYIYRSVNSSIYLG